MPGKKQLPDHGREKHEDDEVVELKRAAELGQGQSLVVAARQHAAGRCVRRWREVLPASKRNP